MPSIKIPRASKRGARFGSDVLPEKIKGITIMAEITKKYNS